MSSLHNNCDKTLAKFMKKKYLNITYYELLRQLVLGVIHGIVLKSFSLQRILNELVYKSPSGCISFLLLINVVNIVLHYIRFLLSARENGKDLCMIT